MTNKTVDESRGGDSEWLQKRTISLDGVIDKRS